MHHRQSTGSNSTFVMSGTPKKSHKRRSHEPYMPKIITTVGQRPACLVNASVTYVGNDEIYAFGGFDQYTDEVYNHVLKLNLNARQWSLVDNYGDIPGVRMGHTACLWQKDKLLVYGGENEHRTHLSDVIIFDLKTAHWIQPELNGPPPRGRARHAAVIHDDKMWISGGMNGPDNSVLGDICYLDLTTWTWSRSWYFVPRYDHSAWIYNDRLWVSGGVTEEMERTGELWWLDLKGVPAFEGTNYAPSADDATPAPYHNGPRFGNFAAVPTQNMFAAPTTYAANSSSVQVNPGPQHQQVPPPAPGAISFTKFVHGQNVPLQNVGFHFHAFSSGCLVDFATPASAIPSLDASLSALDLDTLRWQKLADGKDLFNPNYRWHYCCMNKDGTHAWLLGCPNSPVNRDGQNADSEETLSDVLHVDLRKLGLLGNALAQEAKDRSMLPTSDSRVLGKSHLSGIGADLARTFDKAPELGCGTDFTIFADPDDAEEAVEDDEAEDFPQSPTITSRSAVPTSKPIYVHKLILAARWPHFARVYSSEMAEFHTKKMHIPEPYSAVRAFLYYIYTDSINGAHISGKSSEGSSHSDAPSPSIEDVAVMLVMSNMYDMPRLHHLCVNRLSKEMDIRNAALIFDKASIAQETWLKRRAASFCMTHWGRVVRTEGFRKLRRSAMLDLCEEVDAEGRIVGGEELEAVGGLGGGRFGSGFRDPRKRGRANSSRSMDDGEAIDDDGMEVS